MVQSEKITVFHAVFRVYGVISNAVLGKEDGLGVANLSGGGSVPGLGTYPHTPQRSWLHPMVYGYDHQLIYVEKRYLCSPAA
jgi:hypothetical protein